VTDHLDQANERFRDAAKWLIASSAAVGATLIAGSQLSSIGRLPVGWPDDVAGARLWVAVLGAVIALVGVVCIIWAGARLIPPRLVLIGELADAWDAPPGPLAPVVRFFRQHPKYLQGPATPQAVIERRQRLVDQLKDDDEEAAEKRRERISEMDQRITAIEQMANHQALRADFTRTLRLMLPAVAAVAFGMVAFAWAANPPPAAPGPDLRNAKLVGAFLRDADLRNAKLDGANLTRADLTGAKLEGASLVKVVWQDTICPDGSNSRDSAGTCAGHL
jgi:hypothetical protein